MSFSFGYSPYLYPGMVLPPYFAPPYLMPPSIPTSVPSSALVPAPTAPTIIQNPTPALPPVYFITMRSDVSDVQSIADGNGRSEGGDVGVARGRRFHLYDSHGR